MSSPPSWTSGGSGGSSSGGGSDLEVDVGTTAGYDSPIEEEVARLASRTPDPHAETPGVAEFRQPEVDATHWPDKERMEAEEEEAEESGATLFLPKVFLIRHGQSVFNAFYSAHALLPPKGQTKLSFAPVSPSSGPLEEGTPIAGLPLLRDRKPMIDPRLLDAPLTPHGQKQAREAASKMKSLGPVDLVLSTPLTRAIQTSLLVFRPKDNQIDWKHAFRPSLEQPRNNVLMEPQMPLREDLTEIRVIPYHVEALCASCDVGLPLSILEQRFSAEPNLDFHTARSLMRECWWAGADIGKNISHLNIRRQVAAPSSSSSSSSPSSSSASISLKSLEQVTAEGLSVWREQSSQIEERTRQLLHYLLQLAVDHSRSEEAHRPLRLALVGHCGFFARLTGHSLDNCEILELDWSVVLKRAAVKGYLQLPPGLKTSDVGDPRKQATIVRHWVSLLEPKGTGAGVIPSAQRFSAANPPTSTNTADLHPPTQV